MGMLSFSTLFPEVEEREIRLATPVGDPILPERPRFSSSIAGSPAATAVG